MTGKVQIATVLTDALSLMAAIRYYVQLDRKHINQLVSNFFTSHWFATNSTQARFCTIFQSWKRKAENNNHHLTQVRYALKNHWYRFVSNFSLYRNLLFLEGTRSRRYLLSTKQKSFSSRISWKYSSFSNGTPARRKSCCNLDLWLRKCLTLLVNFLIMLTT